jgi:hypothetical protein
MQMNITFDDGSQLAHCNLAPGFVPQSGNLGRVARHLLEQHDAVLGEWVIALDTPRVGEWRAKARVWGLGKPCLASAWGGA